MIKHTKIKNQSKCHCGRQMSYIKHISQWICPTRIIILPIKLKAKNNKRKSNLTAKENSK
jgi:hypothetical protein